MNTPRSRLKQHATELGLTQEDSKPIARIKEPMGRSDKLLLVGACCVIALASAAFSIWLVVPTLLIASIGCVALVHFIDSTRALSHTSVRSRDDAEDEGEELLRRMSRKRAQDLDEWNRDVVSNPMFRSSLSNINHDDRRRS
jgi:hypothetical protein